MQYPSFYHCGFPLSSLAAVTRNADVLWLFFKNESLRTTSKRFLSSLSVADLIVGLVLGPVWIVIKRWIQPPFNTVLHDFTDLLWIQGNLVLSTELMA